MPKPPHFFPYVASGLLQRVEIALSEERKSLVAYLEVRHATLLDDLRGSFPASRHFPDDGPEVFPPESLPFDKAEHQAHKLLHVTPKTPKTAVCNSAGTTSIPVNGEQEAHRSLQPTRVQISPWASPEPESICRDSLGMSEDSLHQGEVVATRGSTEFIPKSSSDSRIARQTTKAKLITESGEIMTREGVTRRLYARLGYYAMGDWLSANDLHKCLESLTLETFDADRLYHLLTVVHITLFIEEEERPNSPSMMTQWWQQATNEAQMPKYASRFSFAGTMTATSSHQAELKGDAGIHFKTLVDVLCMDDALLQQTFQPEVQAHIHKVRDILLTADANAMIAELMHLRVDDIAAIVPSATFLDLIEPVVGIVILLNGVLIGLQTVPEIAEHSSMLIADIFITCLFILEFVLKLFYNGFAKHFCGPELHWNFFDLVIIVLALIDAFLAIVRVDFDTSAMTIVRMARLTRLARLVRIFRVSWLSELRLLCVGLYQGLKTLFWAVVLLFLIIYVVAVFLTLMIGEEVSETELEFHENFSTLPRAAFTTFRCLLIVDCNDRCGTPILLTALNKYGWVVPVFYIFLFVTVSIGLMNLIMAIYIEATLREAKSEKDTDKEEQFRQSLHVALQLKKLLVKISALQSGHHKGIREDSIIKLMDFENKDSLATSTVDTELEITKEIFMLAIQKPDIQQIMNDLGIPPERAHLFDVMDAQGSGQLKPKSLLAGLLQIRGESRKSDSAALLLAVRYLNTQVTILDAQIEEKHGQLLELLTNITTEVASASRKLRLNFNQG